jgi:predicted glutamine amidotransferase
MCGIIGTITKDTLSTDISGFLEDGFVASQVRGMHSTGIFQIKKEPGSFRMFKKAVTGTEFIDIKQAKDIIADAAKHPATFGHVRHATVGAKNDSNAHPFVAVKDKRRVIGIHNGTLQGWRGKAGADGKDVDSAWAFHTFLEQGPIDAFEYFNGAYAFVWHDSEFPDHIFMARNEERPLHYFVSEDSQTLLIASELGMLGWLADRNKFKRDNKNAQFFYLKPDKVYKFSLKDIGHYEELDRPKYDPSTTVIATTPARHTPYQGRYGMLGDDDAWGNWRGGRNPYYGGYSTYMSQEHVLDACKAALKKARHAIDDKAVDSAALQAGIEKAIAAFGEKKGFDAWALVGEKYKIEDPNNRTATTQEILRAKNMGLYGLAVAFDAVMYDDDTSDTIGETYVDLPGKGIEKIDVIFRGLSKAAADGGFIGKDPQPVAVVGVDDSLIKDQLVLIVSSVSKPQLELLQAKMKETSPTTH